MFTSRGVEMDFGWIPGHVGIQGNEVVDGLAKAALGHSEVNFKMVPGVNSCHANTVYRWYSMQIS